MRRRLGLAALAGLAGILVAASAGRAYFERTEVGARGLGMARTFVAIADDASAIYWNPAGLTQLRRPEVSLTHHRPFMVEDLAQNFAGLAWPTELGTIYGGWSRLGLSGVTAESFFYLGAARSTEWAPGKTVSLGGTLKLAHVGFSGDVATAAGESVDLGSQTKVGADFGVLVRLSPRLTVGYALRNAGKPRFDFIPGHGQTIVDLVHEAGLAYQWHPESKFAVALAEGSEGNLTPMAGAEITFFDVFDMRAGVGDYRFFGGVGVRGDRACVDIGFVTHRTLGITTMATVKIPIGEEPL